MGLFKSDGFFDKVFKGIGKTVPVVILADKANLFNGSNQCKKRGRAHFVGDEGMTYFVENICDQGSPGNFHSREDFINEFAKSNTTIPLTNEDTKKEVEDAKKERTKALQIALAVVVVVIIAILVIRWINKK